MKGEELTELVDSLVIHGALAIALMALGKVCEGFLKGATHTLYSGKGYALFCCHRTDRPHYHFDTGIL